MKKDIKDYKAFNVRIPFDDWLFLKDTSARQQISMNEIIVMCVEKYKKKLERKLTMSDATV
jgi:hypothetical protein